MRYSTFAAYFTSVAVQPPTNTTIVVHDSTFAANTTIAINDSTFAANVSSVAVQSLNTSTFAAKYLTFAANDLTFAANLSSVAVQSPTNTTLSPTSYQLYR
jgi:hypothetical protein